MTPADDAAPPLLSVCVCTHDRPHLLGACLDALSAQEAAACHFEVLVVDSCSGPAAAAAVRALAAAVGNARVLRVEQAGLSRARNAGVQAARGDYVAFLDDDARPAPGWVAAIERLIRSEEGAVDLIGGRVLPLWERPLPRWWPPHLIGLLSITDVPRPGRFYSTELPAGMEPFGVNMTVRRAALLHAGGFDERSGRIGRSLLSDEDVQLARRLRDGGARLLYDPDVLVWHQVQAERLTPQWLLSRLYWQGFSSIVTRRVLGERGGGERCGLARRLAVCLLLAPLAAISPARHWLIAWRCRLAYSLGVLRAAAGRQGLATGYAGQTRSKNALT